MKKLLLTLLLLFSLGFAASAETWSYSVTKGQYTNHDISKVKIDQESDIIFHVGADNELTWKILINAVTGTPDVSNDGGSPAGIRIGAAKKAPSLIKLYTDAFSKYTIKKVSFTCRGAAAAADFDVVAIVGDTTYETKKQSGSTSNTFEWTTNASGNLEIKVTNNSSKTSGNSGFVICGISVEYSIDPTITTTPADLKEGKAESNAVAMGQEVTFTAENVTEGTEIEVLSEYDEDAAFVDGSYTATITKDGTVYIIIGEAEFTYNFTVDQTAKKDAGISFATESVELYQGEAFEAPVLANPNGLTVELTSDNEEVAKVVDGAVVLAGGAGTATITATSVETEEYEAGEASYTITVKAAATCIADMAELAPNEADEVRVNFPITITYVNGSYVYFADEAGDAALLYGKYSVEAGDVIPGGWDAKKKIYAGLPEWEGTIPASTGKAEVEYEMVENVTLSDINKVVILKAVAFDVATPSAKSKDFTGTLLDGTTLKFRTSWALESVPAGIYNVTCIVSYYEKDAMEATDAASMQIVPVSYEDVSTKVSGLSYRVSLADDGTVTVKYDVHVKNHYDGNEYKLLVKIDEGEAEEIVLGEPVEVSPAEGAPMRKPISNTSGDTEGATHVISGTSDLQQKITADAGSTFNVHMAVHVNGEEAHAMEEPAVYTVTTGIADVAVEGQDADAEYFNLQGVRVAQPQAGSIYIVRRAGRVSKELLK